MESKDDRYISVYLKPGELYVGSKPVVVKTVLGSCVAVCLYDTLHKIGGVNHYLLPFSQNDTQNPLNYGEHSIPTLIQLVLDEGGEKRCLVAQLVGGCSMRPDPIIDVGQSNIDIAREILHKYSIPIIGEYVGGNVGRVITFDPYTNNLQIRQAGTSPNSPTISSTYTKEESVQISTSQAQLLTNKFMIGLQRAHNSLETMLQTTIAIEINEVSLRQMGYVQDYVRQKNLDFMVNTGPKEIGTIGEVLLVIDPTKMGIFVNALLHRPLTNIMQYTKMECSVILEFANIFINAILGTLANHLGFSMILRVPFLIRGINEVNSLGFMKPIHKWKLALATKTRITIPAWQMDTTILLLVELNSSNIFFDKLGS